MITTRSVLSSTRYPTTPLVKVQASVRARRTLMLRTFSHSWTTVPYDETPSAIAGARLRWLLT